MDTQGEFGSSLESMKRVIETAVIMVGKRGWSKSDVDWFCREADMRHQRFVEAMGKAAADGDSLHSSRSCTARIVPPNRAYRLVLPRQSQ
jgi:hypothetical protein